MTRKTFLKTAIGAAFVGFIFCFGALRAQAQTTIFTYQGKLTDGAQAAGGTYDLGFALFDAETGGTQIGTAIMRSNVSVSGGIFTVQLDFGATAFSGANRFLQIEVRKTPETTFTTLAPRQPLTSSPYSIRTISAAAADSLSGSCASCVTNTNINSVDGAKISGSITTATIGGANVTGTVANATTAGNVSGVVAIGSGGTGSATKNFVDLTTVQTIAGAKTFTDNLRTGGTLTIGSVGSSGGTIPLCANGLNLVTGCNSSRYGITFTTTGSSFGPLNHNLNTMDVMVSVYKSNGDGTFNQVLIDNSTIVVILFDANNIKLFITAAGTYKVLIWR